MASFPMFVSLEGRACLIVGGGRVAARKCRGLLDFGAEVTVVAEKIRWPAGLHSMGGRAAADEGTKRLHRIERPFQETDVTERDWMLVIAATDDRAVNSRVARLCRKRNIPVNVADCRAECTFFFPAYWKEGNVVTGISTSGKSPGLAAALRKRLEEVLPEWKKEMEQEIAGKDRVDNG